MALYPVISALKASRSKATSAIPLSLAVVPHGATTPVGTVSLSGLEDPPGVNIGWYLHPDAGGRGWASEAARVLLGHALDAGHDLVWAMMWEHNAASAAVCRRIGMEALGVHVDPWYGTRDYPHSRFFCAGPGTDGARDRLVAWGRVADLADEPDLVPPPGLDPTGTTASPAGPEQPATPTGDQG